MGIHNTFFNKTANDWCYNGGFENRAELFECVKSGDLESFDRIFGESAALLKNLIGDDLPYAKSVILYIFAQLQLVAVWGGIPVTHCHAVQEAYYQALDQAESPQAVINLLREQCEEFLRMSAALKKERGYSSMVKDCFQYIREHLYDDLRVPMIAEDLSFSESYLSHRFKKETGISLVQAMRRERIAEAKLLIRTDCSYSEIAALLGFASQSHFSDAFKQETGMSPSAFRKSAF